MSVCGWNPLWCILWKLEWVGIRDVWRLQCDRMHSLFCWWWEAWSASMFRWALCVKVTFKWTPAPRKQSAEHCISTRWSAIFISTARGFKPVADQCRKGVTYWKIFNVNSEKLMFANWTQLIEDVWEDKRVKIDKVCLFGFYLVEKSTFHFINIPSFFNCIFKKYMRYLDNMNIKSSVRCCWIGFIL